MMRNRILAAVAVATVATTALAGCSSSKSGSSASTANNKVGILLPDTSSSPRWVSADPNELANQCTKYNLDCKIYNANGSDSTQEQQAQQLISWGAGVILEVDLDSSSGAQIEKLAKSKGVVPIDYDRLTQGGGASYYVSFDNVKVGTAIGTGLVKCLKDDGKSNGGVVLLNGSPTDNNATQFKQGYLKVIKDAGYSVVADQSVPDWDPLQAGTLFEQIDTKYKGKFVGVAAANDNLGGAVIARLNSQGLAGKIPVTGQDAGDEGLQRVLLGTQCVSVYKSVKKEANAAADITAKLIKGDTAGADAVATAVTKDTKLNSDVKSVLLDPVAIYQDNVMDVIEDGATTAEKLCTTADLKKACTDHGDS